MAKQYQPLAQALSTSRIPGIDFLRVSAVLLVMAGHAGLLEFTIGLEILLVISGFLITWLLLDEYEKTGTISLRTFYWRRATRLLPAFYLYVALGMAYLAIRGKPVPWGAVTASLFHVLNYYQGLTGGGTHYLSHAWSLSLQEQFYLLWPVAVLFMLNRGLHLERIIVLSVVMLWIVRAYECLVLGFSDPYLYRALESRADALAMGSLLAVMLKNPKCVAVYERLAPYAVWVLACAWLALTWSISIRSSSDAYKYGVGLGLESLIITGVLPFFMRMAAGDHKVSTVMRSTVVASAGKASYSMYLLHGIFMHGLISGQVRVGVPTVAAFGASVCAIGYTAHLSYRHVEHPIRVWLEGWRARRQADDRHHGLTARMAEG